MSENIFNNCKVFENGGVVNIKSNEYYKILLLKFEFNNCEVIIGGGIYLNLGNVEISVVNCIFDSCRLREVGFVIYYNEFVIGDDNNFSNVILNCSNLYNFQ